MLSLASYRGRARRVFSSCHRRIARGNAERQCDCPAYSELGTVNGLRMSCWFLSSRSHIVISSSTGFQNVPTILLSMAIQHILLSPAPQEHVGPRSSKGRAPSPRRSLIQKEPCKPACAVPHTLSPHLFQIFVSDFRAPRRRADVVSEVVEERAVPVSARVSIELKTKKCTSQKRLTRPCPSGRIAPSPRGTCRTGSRRPRPA